MCGIFGAIQFAQPKIQPNEFVRRTQLATDALAHRGPDDQGIWIHPELNVTFGHRRLSVIDVSSRSKQPMTDPSTGAALTFNGEIYNYKELKSELHEPHFATTSDTEVLLKGLEEKGPKFISRLDGMFAFGFYQNHQLLLAVDPAGKKPLYTYWDGKVFAFASEIKAFSAFGDLHLQIEEKFLKQYLIYGYVPGANTVFKHIKKLQAGHYQVVRPQDSEPTAPVCYWDVPIGNINRSLSYQNAKGQLKELLSAAVKKRLVADVPVGSFLSGGIDSSIISYEAARALAPGKLHTFCMGFSGHGPKFDESQFARQVAKRIGSKHTQFNLEKIPTAELMAHFDEPFADSSALPTALLCQKTSQHVKVVLSGDGGDELFGGYRRFQAALATEKNTDLLRQILGPLEFHRPAPRSRREYFNRFKKGLSLPLLQRLVRWNSYFTADEFQRFFNEDIAEHLSELEAFDQKTAGLEVGEKILYFNFKTYLFGDLLPKVDRMSMRYGLEVRSPFLDKKLIEFAFSLPTSFKFNFLQTKIILKDTYAPALGWDIVKRRKQGFAYPNPQASVSAIPSLKNVLNTIEIDQSLNPGQIFMLESADSNLAGRV